MSQHRSPITFMFPGQGSQQVGMGRDLAAMYPVAQETFDEADEALGYRLSQLCFEGPEDQLKLTEITQPADSDGFGGGLACAAVEGNHALLRCGT